MRHARKIRKGEAPRWLAFHVCPIICLCVSKPFVLDLGKHAYMVEPFPTGGPRCRDIFKRLTYASEQIVDFVWSTLLVCEATGNSTTQTAYDMQSALLVFDSLSTFLLLFVAIWTLNNMLRKQLGHTSAMLKIILMIDLAILGALLLVITVLAIYSYHYLVRTIYESPANIGTILSATQYITLAFNAVVVVSILGSGALSLVAARSLKKKHIANTVSP